MEWVPFALKIVDALFNKVPRINTHMICRITAFNLKFGCYNKVQDSQSLSHLLWLPYRNNCMQAVFLV